MARIRQRCFEERLNETLIRRVPVSGKKRASSLPERNIHLTFELNQLESSNVAGSSSQLRKPRWLKFSNTSKEIGFPANRGGPIGFFAFRLVYG